jgi:hypothetical protein
VRSQLAAAADAAAEGRAAAAAARRAAADQAARIQAHVEEGARRADEAARAAARLQAQRMEVRHAESTARERAERQAALDALRLRVGALGAALGRRGEAARAGHEAQQLAQGAFGLGDALARGAPVDAPAAYLRAACAGDALVEAAVAALPGGGGPVPTREQLGAEFARAARAARELSALPAGRGGLLSVAAAKLGAKLKVGEAEPLASALPGGGVDRALAAAQARLAAGDLLAAARGLEGAAAGTAAAPAVAGWVRAARRRAAAEQAAALLEAHAAALTASLA